MTENMVQIFSGLSILIILITSFKYNEHVFDARVISYLAVFLTLAVVISFFSFKAIILGGQIVFSFGQMPMMVLGAVLGPWFGAIGGLIRDIIGLITSPTAFPFLGFTLNKVLVPFIVALSVKHLRYNRKRKLWLVVNIYLVYTILILLIGLKNLTNSILFVFSLIIFLFLFNFIYLRYQKRLPDTSRISFYVGVILVELIVQGTLTPIWLNVMFKTPFLISSSMRLLKGIILIFVNCFIGGRLFEIADRVVNKNESV